MISRKGAKAREARITNQQITNNSAKRIALENAVRLNPFEAQYHLSLGWAYAHQWKEPDYYRKWFPAADISMDRAAYFAGVKNPRLHIELGNYWVMRSKSILPNNPEHHSAWAKARWHYGKAMEIEGGLRPGEAYAPEGGRKAVVRSRRTEVGGQEKEHKKQRAESKELKRMKKEIRDYAWNFYPDEEMVEQLMESSRFD